MREVARDMGKGDSYNRAPVGVYFGTPDVEADDPYFGGEGPKRRGCVNCGNCMIGSGRNAKNKLTVNYLYLAEKRGAVIHELQEVHEIKPLPAGGFAVEARHPGWLQRAAHLDRHTYTAAQVIVSAHAYGSAKLLHRLKHTGMLAGLSDQLGQRARTNSQQLISIERAMSLWPNKGEADPRPPLGSGYHRLKAVMPHRPIVPAGAPAELRLDAKKDDVIPLYPY